MSVLIPSRISRVAIVGLGHIGRVHVAALRASGRFQVVALCDHDQALHQIAEDVAFYTDPDEVFALSGLDAVIIATPNRTHYALALAAIENGHNIIIEKPAAGSLAEMEDIEARASVKGVHVFYAFHSAQAMDVQWFRNYMRDHGRALGPITGFQCNFYDPYIQQGQLIEHAAGLENPWRDSGVNALSVLSELLDVTALQATARYETPFEHPVCKARATLVQYAFPTQPGNLAGLGYIDTNWDLNLNFKQTRLSFGETGFQVLLDHSGQQVVMWDPQGGRRVAADFSATNERLLNHYISVFDQYRNFRSHGQFNRRQAFEVHGVLFASEQL